MPDSLTNTGSPASTTNATTNHTIAPSDQARACATLRTIAPNTTSKTLAQVACTDKDFAALTAMFRTQADEWTSSLTSFRESDDRVKRDIADLTSLHAAGNAVLPAWLVVLKEQERDVEAEMRMFEKRAENCAIIEGELLIMADERLSEEERKAAWVRLRRKLKDMPEALDAAD